MTIEGDTLRHAAYDGQDWQTVALAVLADPASKSAPVDILKVLARVGIHGDIQPGDAAVVRAASDAIDGGARG